MWKVFAIFCVLLPGGECEKKYEYPEIIYTNKEECLIKAQWKAHEMMKFINETGSALSFNIGCEYQGELEQDKKDEQLNNYNRKRQRSLDRPI